MARPLMAARNVHPPPRVWSTMPPSNRMGLLKKLALIINQAPANKLPIPHRSRCWASSGHGDSWAIPPPPNTTNNKRSAHNGLVV